jgi:Na+/melibiose symporter-like transporter
VVVILACRGLPSDRGRDTPLHWPGAACLTVGATLVMTAATVVPQRAVPVGVDIGLGVAGVATLALFVILSRRAAQPMIVPGLILELRFLRSSIATLTQMFALMCVLVAVPLYLTGTLHHSTAVAGALFFALPAAMALLAPLVGMLSDRVGARRVLRLGLGVLAVSCLALGWFTQDTAHSLVLLCGLLILVGVGVALVQTPAATGATRSPAGQTGAALGLFNMVRFGGSAFGAAWVAVLYPRGSLFLLFGGSALLLVGALVATLLGTDPELTGVRAQVEPV